jgi:corin
LKQAYFKSNGSELLVTDGEVEIPDIILINPAYNKSTAAPTVSPNEPIPARTTDASLSGEQGHRNTSKSEGVSVL